MNSIPIQRKTLLFLSVLLLLASGFVLFNYWSLAEIDRELLRQVEVTQEIQTRQAALDIESHVSRVEDELVSLSQFPSLEQVTPERCKSTLPVHQKVGSTLESVLRADKTGEITACSSALYASYEGINIRNKLYFTRPRSSGEPFSQIVGDQLFVSVPLFVTTRYTPYPNFEGEFNGVLLSILSIDNLQERYVRPALHDQARFVIVDVPSGSILLQSPGANLSEFINVTDSSAVLDSEEMGESLVTSEEFRISGTRWRLVAATPLAALASDARDAQFRLLVGLLLILLTLSVLTFSLVSAVRSRQVVQDQLTQAQATMREWGIASKTYTPADIPLDPGTIYLVDDGDDIQAIDIFIGVMNRGYTGIGFVRQSPPEIRKRYSIDVPLTWISSEERDAALPVIQDKVRRFLADTLNPVILLERIEFLVLKHGLDEVLRFTHSVKDLVSQRRAIVILGAKKDALSPGAWKALATETTDPLGSDLRKKMHLELMEKEILSFVNEQNVKNVLVSYSEITQKLGVTKPTTRAKISRLEQLGLLHVEQRGRFKALKITSLGRTFLG